MATLTNLTTNEMIQLPQSYNKEHQVTIPAVLLYWAKDELVIGDEHNGTIIRGRSDSDTILDWLNAHYRCDFTLFTGVKRNRPPVIGGSRVFHVALPKPRDED